MDSRRKSRRWLEVALALIVIGLVAVVVRHKARAEAEAQRQAEEKVEQMVAQAKEKATDLAHIGPKILIEGVKAHYSVDPNRTVEAGYRVQLIQLTRELEKDPDNLDILESKYHLHIQLEERGKALETLDRLTAADPEDQRDGLNSKAYLLAEMGQFGLALPSAERSVALSPDSPDCLDTLGFVLVGLGENKRASEVYTRALALEPEHPYALWGRAAAQYRLGRLEEARRDLQKLAEIDSDFCLHWTLEADPGQELESANLL